MCLFSLVLGLALFLPICSTLLHLEARCAGLAAFQSVTMQAGEVLLMKVRRCSLGSPVSKGTSEMGQLVSVFWGVGLPLVLFSHPRGDRCCWYHIHFSLGWMQTVTGGGFYSLDVNAFTSKALSATVSSRSSSKCLHGIKSQG